MNKWMSRLIKYIYTMQIYVEYKHIIPKIDTFPIHDTSTQTDWSIYYNILFIIFWNIYFWFDTSIYLYTVHKYTSQFFLQLKEKQ